MGSGKCVTLVAVAVLAALADPASGAKRAETLADAFQGARVEPMQVAFWTSDQAPRRRGASGAIDGGPLSHVLAVCRSTGRPLEQKELEAATRAVREIVEKWGGGTLVSCEVLFFTPGHVAARLTPSAPRGFGQTTDGDELLYRFDPDRHSPKAEAVEWYARSMWCRPYDLERRERGDEERVHLAKVHGWQHYAWWAGGNVPRASSPRKVLAFPERID